MVRATRSSLSVSYTHLDVYKRQVTDTRELTEGELIELLSEGTLRTHRSAQHESSCGYRTEKDGSVTVVWYESETDIAEKTELCRLLGIGNVYVLK